MPSIIDRKYDWSELEEQPRASAPDLRLKWYRIEKWFMPKDGGAYMLFLINLRSTWHFDGLCPVCKLPGDIIRDGLSNPPTLIRDVSRDGCSVEILTQLQRLRCNKCGARWTASNEELDDDFSITKRLREYLKVQSFLQPFTALAKETGLQIKTIGQIMDEEIKKQDEFRKMHPLEAPRALGVDEKHIIDDMGGVFINDDTGRLLEMTEDIKKESMAAAITSLSNWDKNIKVVTTDMNNQYLSWMPLLLKDATFVVDKFHVIKALNQKVNKAVSAFHSLRKERIAKISDPSERNRQSNILELITPYLYTFKTENLLEKGGERLKRMATVNEAFPEFAHLRKFVFLAEEMYKQTTLKDAEKIYDEWVDLLPPTVKKEYEPWYDDRGIPIECHAVFKTFHSSGFVRYKEYILNYFKPGCNCHNGATEGVNRLIQSLNVAGNGYGFKHLRAKALYLSNVGKFIPRYGIKRMKFEKWKPTVTYTTSPGLGSGEITKTETVYEFTEKQELINYPEVSVFDDLTWLNDSFMESEPLTALPTLNLESIPDDLEFKKSSSLSTFLNLGSEDSEEI